LAAGRSDGEQMGGFTGAGASLLNFELETVLRFTAGNVDYG